MYTQRIDILSLFPAMFTALEHGVTGRPACRDRLSIHTWNPRDYSLDKYQRVDDRPFGGGPGMLMSIQALADTLAAAQQAAGQEAIKPDQLAAAQITTPNAGTTSPPQTKPNLPPPVSNNTDSVPPSPRVIYLTPCGQPLTQDIICKLARQPQLILIAGRYLGIDQRFIDHHVDACYSIGDFVVSGGELPAMMLIDALARQLPGVLGNQASAAQDSFMHGLLDCPHYTRPAVHPELGAIPEVLRSGDHQAISAWQQQQSLLKTWQQRPDMLKNTVLTSAQKQCLENMKQTQCTLKTQGHNEA